MYKKVFLTLAMMFFLGTFFSTCSFAKDVNLNANKIKTTCGYLRLEDPDTATYLRPVKVNVKTVYIPNQVVLNDYPIRIIAIHKNAFTKTKKLRKISVGKNVFLIPKGTFKKAPKKVKIYTDIGAGVRTIRKSGIKKGQVIIWR